MEVKAYVKGYNLIPFPYHNGEDKVYFPYTTAGVKFTLNNDNTITANGTVTSEVWFRIGKVYVDKGKTYYISGTPSASFTSTRWGVTISTRKSNDAEIDNHYAPTGYGYYELKVSETSVISYFYIYIVMRIGQTFDNAIFKPMLSVGESKPYDNGRIRVKPVVPVRNPKNLIPFPYIVESGYTNSAGITITYDKYGTLTFSGTSTADRWVSTRMQSKFYLPLGEYTVIVPRTAPLQSQIKIRRYAAKGNNIENIQAMPYAGVYSKDFSVTDETEYFTFELAFKAKTTYEGSCYVAVIKKGEVFDNPISPQKCNIFIKE